MKKVVIVEKIKTIREGIKILVNRFSEFDCNDSFESFDLLKSNFEKINPDIILIDFQHKGVEIIEEIRSLKLSKPDIVIILLIMNEENDLIFDALTNGASAYIHKNAPSQRLVKVLNETVNGMITVNSFIARKTIKFIKGKNLSSKYERAEIKLLLKLTEGNNLLAIEKSLKMNSDEIKVSFKRIYDKLFESNTRKLAV